MDWVSLLRAWVEAHGALGLVGFSAIYVLSALLFVPGAVLTFLAGGLFGVPVGLVVVAVSTSVADAVAFLVGRHLARDVVVRLARRSRRFGAIDAAVTQGGWRVVALLRLSPTIPYSASNYLYGVTGIGFWPYWITSGLFTLPGILAYVYLGYVGAETVGGGTSRTTVDWAFLIIGLIATLAATAYVGALAHRRLAQDPVTRDRSGHQPHVRS